MKQTATLRYLRIAPRKVRAVADLIRGLPVNEAEAQLLVEPRRPARSLLKLLRSAVANAKNVKKLESNRLFIESIQVDQGPMLKRYLPRARGVATPIQKKMSHVVITLEEKADMKPRFKIVIQKKAKLPPEERKQARKPEKDGGRGGTEREEKAKSQGGGWRKFFRRKAI